MSRSKKITYTSLVMTGDAISGVAASSYTNAEIKGFDQNGVTLAVIPESDVINGIFANKWVKGFNSIPYGSGDVSKSYVSSGHNVYLNLGTNAYNNISTNYASVYEPSHTSGIHTYGDGNTWLMLYKIPYSMAKFIGSYIPLAGFDILVDAIVDFETNTLPSTATVNCSLYKDGTLHSSLITSNFKCNEIKKALYNDTFEVQITPFSSAPSQGISLEGYHDRFVSLYETNIIPRTNFARSIYENSVESGLSLGSILTAYIDVNAIENTSVPVNIAIGITGPGTGAALSFMLNVSGTTTANIIGIHVDSHGTSYTAPVGLYIIGDISGEQSSDILDNIQVVVSGLPRFGFRICDVFDAENSLFGAKQGTIVNSQNLATTTTKFSSIIPSSGKINIDAIPSVVGGTPITTKGGQSIKSAGSQYYNTNTIYERR